MILVHPRLDERYLSYEFVAVGDCVKETVRHVESRPLVALYSPEEAQEVILALLRDGYEFVFHRAPCRPGV